MRNILPGDSLFLAGDGCTNSNGELVLKFSKKFLDTIEIRKQNGYVLNSVKVNFIVYWLNEETQHEVKIILPELCFEKQLNEE
jgi:ATP-dependent DNA helicase RecQ